MNYELNDELKIILKDKNLTFEKVNIKDFDIIWNLYLERIEWFKQNDIHQWDSYLEHHPKEEFIDVINNSNFFMLKEQDKIIAVFELSDNSKFWKDDITKAYYIYKLSVKVGYKNIGELIFEICKYISKNNNMNYLRLDCVQSNAKLNQIYENHGFKLARYGQQDYYNYSLRELKIN